MPDGLSAASALTAINTRKETATSRSSILKSSKAPHRHASPLQRGEGGMFFLPVEIRQPTVRLKLTIFHVVGGRSTAASGSEGASEVAGEPTLRRRPGATGSGDKSIGVDIPVAAGIIVTQHRGIGFGFICETERQVTFDETLQSLRHMRRRLKIVDDAFEAVHRCQVLSAS